MGGTLFALALDMEAREGNRWLDRAVTRIPDDFFEFFPATQPAVF
jgi:hypothetical protein